MCEGRVVFWRDGEWLEWCCQVVGKLEYGMGVHGTQGFLLEWMVLHGSGIVPYR